METFSWNSPSPAESLKTIKPFDGILLGFGHFGSQINSTIEATHNYFGTNCLPYQRRLPSNGCKNSGFYDQFDHNAYF